MKKMTYLLRVCLLLLCMLMLASCHENYYDANAGDEIVSRETPNPQIILDETAVVLEIGDIYTFTATVTNEPKEKIKIVWSTSDAKIADISEAGSITAKKSGTAVITAASEDGSVKTDCLVTVSKLKKAIITGNIPAESESEKTYSVSIDFENCVNPSVKVIANCKGGSVQGSEEKIPFGSGESQIKALGKVTVSFTTSSSLEVSSLRLLCFDNNVLIDTKEYLVKKINLD